MAVNPIQQVLQMVMQNPQMLQQVMQMASSPQAQGMLQMLMQPGQQQPPPGSQELSDVPLPRSLGGGSPYPTFNEEQDDKAYVRELRQDNLVPPSYPRGQPLTPEILEILQRQKPPVPTPQTHPEEYLNPGTREPIAGIQPGLLTRLAMANPAQMPQDIPADLNKAASKLRDKRQLPEEDVRETVFQMIRGNPALLEDFAKNPENHIPEEDVADANSWFDGVFDR
jgi:hypothetical protein